MLSAVPRPARRLGFFLLLALPAAAGGLLWYRSVDAHLRAAEASLADHDDAGARDHLARYLVVWPGDPRAHLLAARVARRERHYDEAEEHLRHCRRAGGYAAAVAVERALADLQRGDGRAEPDLRARAEAGDAESLPVLEVLTQYYLDSYRLDRAGECLGLYLRQRPDDLLALLGRGYVRERFLDFAAAAADYRRAVAAHPDDDRARRRLGETLLVSGDPAEALPQFEHLLARDPGDAAARLGLARCQRQLGRAAEAAATLDALLADGPPPAAALAERGEAALDAGDAAGAEKWLRKAAAAAPHDRKAHAALARCLEQQGKSADAEAARGEVRRIDADLRRLDELSRAVIHAPDDAALRVEGGLLFLRGGEPEEGVRWLNHALRLDPSRADARRALAEYYEKNGRKGSAEAHRRFLREHPAPADRPPR